MACIHTLTHLQTHSGTLARTHALIRHLEDIKCYGFKSAVILPPAFAYGSFPTNDRISHPYVHGLSNSLDTRLHCMLARALRVCLGVPWATYHVLVLAEIRGPPVHAPRIQQTCRHLFRNKLQHRGHPLSTALSTRNGSPLDNVLTWNDDLLPVDDKR